MAWTLVDHVEAGFADGNGGHALSMPNGGQANTGDIDVIIVGSDTTVSTPTGFTLPANGSHVGNQGGYAFYRICVGGESSTVTITTAGNFDTSAGFSRWSGGVSFDLAGNSFVDNSGNTANPALSTGTLGGADELIVAASVNTDASGSNATTPVWGNSFTALGSASSGTASAASVGFFAYKTGVGTASESVSVTWTNSMRNRYAFFLSFKRADPIVPDQSGSTSMTAGTTSANVDITAAAAGAWCYCWVALGANSGAVSATGWTSLLDSDEGTAAHYALLRRQKQAGDTSFTFGWTNSTKGTLAWKSYLGLDGVTPDEQATLATNGVTSRTAVPTSSATPTAQDRWVVACFAVRTTNVANKPITWTSDAALTERVDVDNNAAGSSPWLGVEIADSNAIVTQASHSYTATHNVAESHDGSAIFFLIPGAAVVPFNPQRAVQGRDVGEAWWLQRATRDPSLLAAPTAAVQYTTARSPQTRDYGEAWWIQKDRRSASLVATTANPLVPPLDSAWQAGARHWHLYNDINERGGWPQLRAYISDPSLLNPPTATIPPAPARTLQGRDPGEVPWIQRRPADPTLLATAQLEGPLLAVQPRTIPPPVRITPQIHLHPDPQLLTSLDSPLLFSASRSWFPRPPLLVQQLRPGLIAQPDLDAPLLTVELFRRYLTPATHADRRQTARQFVALVFMGTPPPIVTRATSTPTVLDTRTSSSGVTEIRTSTRAVTDRRTSDPAVDGS